MEQINFRAMNEMISQDIESFLAHFSLEYSTYQNRIALSCPMHESSRGESLTIFTSGNETCGNYVCWTKHCELEHGKGIFNLIKFLHEQKYNKSPISTVVKFVEQICNRKCDVISDVQTDELKFNNFVKSMNIKASDLKIIATREYVRNTLAVPAQYYINRGYKTETLKDFDIGFCSTKGQPMFMRVVVPIYEATGQFMIGCVGRSINDKCSICEKYHYKNKMCPSSPIEEKWACKWINSTGFQSGNYLYNMWNAIEACKENQKIIIVEGPGDVWRMHEAGFRNVVALFGCNLTDNQFELLETMGVMDIYLALDNDDAGKKAKEKIGKRLAGFYNVHEVVFSKKDTGDMTIEEIQTVFKGML